jgi:hypothetical protein
MNLFKLALFCTVTSFVGCTSTDLTRSSTPTSFSNQLRLNARMSDEAILNALGFDRARMKIKHYSGTDGYETDYTTNGGDSISITRSVVTGVFIFQNSRNGSRSWQLGGK